MNKKVSNLIDLEYYGNVNLCNELLKKWRDAKPNNEDLKLFTTNYLDIIFYVNSLEMERFGYEKAMSEYLSDKLRAVERARRSEAENEKLKAEIKTLKSLINL